METVPDERIKVFCQNCNHPMISESTDMKRIIYLCELCKHEIRLEYDGGAW